MLLIIVIIIIVVWIVLYIYNRKSNFATPAIPTPVNSQITDKHITKPKEKKETGFFSGKYDRKNLNICNC